MTSVLRSSIFFASSEVMHRPKSDSSLHFDVKSTYQIRTGKKKLERYRSAFASRRGNSARALAAGLPRQDHF